MTDWKTHTPQYDGHAPDDWDGHDVKSSANGCDWVINMHRPINWLPNLRYLYHSKPQDATHEPDLLAQCLALPQADRDALIEALQKPQRDWADDLAKEVRSLLINCAKVDQVAKVIRSKCQPKSIGEKLREALQNEPI